jgi:Ran GTPase-activating protein (RanGAP) involved in mRNA processing and transport
MTAHRSLRTLDLSVCFIQQHVPALAAALGALVKADAPALQELHLSEIGLGDAGLGALVDALPLNTHLRTLHLADNGCTEAFIRDRLLPAVRANTSLQHLAAVDFHRPPAAGGVHRRTLFREAEALVNARRAAAP